MGKVPCELSRTSAKHSVFLRRILLRRQVNRPSGRARGLAARKELVLRLHPSVPLLGSRERKLRKGDLVFLDIACGIEGYHTDKTVTYMFGPSLPDDVIQAQRKCVEIQNAIAAQLKPGVVPSRIYQNILQNLPGEFLNHFMGFGNRRAKFLGHGIGLQVDETPVIAEGFDEPLVENMVFAVEPKKGIQDVGMVGIENTFVVSPQGGRGITGTHPGLILV